MDNVLIGQWLYFWCTGKFWSVTDDWRVMYELVRPFKHFDGVIGC